MGHNLKFKKMEIPEAIKLIQEMKSWMPSDNKNFDKEREAIDTVVKAFEKPTYTAEDMEAFAEWCSFKYEFNPFFNKWRKSDQTFKHFVDNIDNAPTTIQLREMWEQEGGEK